MTAVVAPHTREVDVRRVYALWLTVAFTVAQLLTLAYASQLGAAVARHPTVDTTVLTVGILLQSTIAYLVVRLALHLGTSIGLGGPLLVGWRTASHRRALRALGLSSLAGVAAVPCALGLMMLLQRGVRELPQGSIAPWAVAMACVGAGIQEEILFRLGAMTVLAWLFSRVFRVPGAAAVWGGNIVAAVLFGAAHLPIAAALGGLTPPTVTFVFAANGLVGVVCGWLYWRKGLLAAMTAHASFDLVLKVLLPALSSTT